MQKTKVIRLEKELQNVKEACKDMHNLLKLKINEKETFQRALCECRAKSGTNEKYFNQNKR